MNDCVAVVVLMLRIFWWGFCNLFLGPLFAWPRGVWRRLHPYLVSRGWTLAMWMPFAFWCGVWLIKSFGFHDPDALGAAGVKALAHGIMAVVNSPLKGVQELALPTQHSMSFTGIASLALQVCAGSTLFFGPLHVLGLRIWPAEQPPDASHGSARWGEVSDVAHALAPKGSRGGLMLGRLLGREPKNCDPRYRVGQHVLTCAPTGAGKGIGCVMPNLLEYPGSVVCLDVKGENYAVTAEARRCLGQEVFCLDPFKVTDGQGHRLNWLDVLDLDSEDCVSEAAALADTLVLRSRDATDSHWDDAAAGLLQGLLLYVAGQPEGSRHMGKLRELLTLPEPALIALLGELGGQPEPAFGVVARTANAFLAKADRERSGVLSTAQRHTAFLDDPRIVRSLSASDFDFARLKGEDVTVYIVLPPDKLMAYNRFARASLGLALKAVMRTPGLPQHEVLFLLDEFAQLGHFGAAEDAISILRGYGGILWLFVQDLSQLQAVYPKWRTFLANSVLQAFGAQDLQTARYISESLGTQTIRVRSENRSTTNHAWETSTSVSEGYNLHGRSLLTVDEVRRLRTDRVLVFEQGVLPMMLQRLNYLADRESAGLAAANPMFSLPAAKPRPSITPAVARSQP
jgi:type IV secretory pathway TraG/TraD family ATPase VirD4